MAAPRARIPVLLATAAVVAGLSACGGGDDAGYGGAPAGQADPAASTPAVGTILTANSTAQLGTVVIDGQGYTLYRSDKDTAQPPTSNCDDDCARQWPPVLATPGAPLTVEGVDQTAVGTIARPDGTVQLTLGGWPIYRFSGDTQPGSTTGQGVDGSWAAVTPEGKKASPAD